jgi:hypothetical protein
VIPPAPSTVGSRILPGLLPPVHSTGGAHGPGDPLPPACGARPHRGTAMNIHSHTPAVRATPSECGGISPTTRPDEIWDAVAGLWFGGAVAAPHRSRVGKVVRDLTALSATAAEIRRRFAAYRAKWPRCAATPEALVKHWASFASSASVVDSAAVEHSRQERLAAEEIMRHQAAPPDSEWARTCRLRLAAAIARGGGQ